MLEIFSKKHTIKQSIIFLSIITALNAFYAVISPVPTLEVISTILTFIVLLVAIFTPWNRLSTNTPIVVYFLAMIVIGITTYMFDGTNSGNGAYYVLALVWVGLNFSKKMLYLSIPVAFISYLVPVALVDDDLSDLFVAFATIIIATVVSYSMSVIRETLISTTKSLHIAQNNLNAASQSLSDVSLIIKNDIIPHIEDAKDLADQPVQEKLNYTLRLLRAFTANR